MYRSHRPKTAKRSQRAESIEEARAVLPVQADWAPIDEVAVTPRASGFAFLEPDFAKGDVSAGLVQGEHRVQAEFLQPSRHHNPMEPSASLAIWDGDTLILHDATQHVYGVRAVIADLFGVAADKVRVLCPHTGGGFGLKGFVWPPPILAAAAAKAIGRPVKLVCSRADMYSFLGYQPRTAQKVTLACDAAGRLSALRHESVNLTTVSDDFPEYAMKRRARRTPPCTGNVAACGAGQRGDVDRDAGSRGGPGLWALESAVDELADSPGVDPLDLRLANYAEEDPATGQPWSSKELREAYEEGAAVRLGQAAEQSAARQ